MFGEAFCYERSMRRMQVCKKEDFTQVIHTNSTESAGKNVQKTGSGQPNVQTDQKGKGKIEVKEQTGLHTNQERLGYSHRSGKHNASHSSV